MACALLTCITYNGMHASEGERIGGSQHQAQTGGLSLSVKTIAGRWMGLVATWVVPQGEMCALVHNKSKRAYLLDPLLTPS
eukprot:7273959-Pyramimonas_sp.AAC.1